MKYSLPPLDVLRQLIDYNPNTGILTWKFRDKKFCKSSHDQARWNKRFCGKTAGLIAKDGYGVICIFDNQYKSHRICWYLYYGAAPNGQIDHVNGQKSDNRIRNLRDVSARENALNRKIYSTNKSGYIGVSQNVSGKWVAHISTKEKRVYLGKFNCVTAAAIRRLQAQNHNGYHPNHGRQPK